MEIANNFLFVVVSDGKEVFDYDENNNGNSARCSS